MQVNRQGKEPTRDMSERSGGSKRSTREASQPGRAMREVPQPGLVLERESRPARRGPGHDAARPGGSDWHMLVKVAEAPQLGPNARARLITAHPDHAASQAFDQLRTRLMRALQAHSWKRVAVTAPTPGCGTTFAAANLALSIARLPNVRTLLMDLDLGDPRLAGALNLRRTGPLEPVLYGSRAPERHLFRIGENLALGLNDQPMDAPATWLQHPETWRVLDGIQDRFRPDVTIFDLPPMLGRDDTEAILPKVDGVLLVTDGTRTVARQIAECERLLDGHTPLLGVILNRADPRRSARAPNGAR